MCEDTFKLVPSIRGTKVLEKGTFGELACRYGTDANGAGVMSMEQNGGGVRGGNHG